MFSTVYRCARTAKIGHRTSTRFNRVWVQFTYGWESSRSSNFEFTFEVNWNAVFDAECTEHADSKDDVFSWGERLLVIEHLGDVIDMLTGWKLSHNLSLLVGVAVNWCCFQFIRICIKDRCALIRRISRKFLSREIISFSRRRERVQRTNFFFFFFLRFFRNISFPKIGTLKLSD